TETTEAFEQLLGAAQTFGLTIYSGEDSHTPENAAVTFVDPHALEHVSANHAVYVNGESAGLPAHVLQAAASGAAVVSVPNRVLEDALGAAVTVARTTEEAKEAIEGLLSDDARRAAIRGAGFRAVLSKHTMRHRIAALARTTGFTVDEGFDVRFAALVLAANARDAEAIGRRLWSQTNVAEILVGIPDPVPPQQVTEEEGLLVRVVEQDPSSSESDRWRGLAAVAASPWVVPMAADGDAAPVNDLLLAQRFACADVLGLGEAFAFTDAVDPAPAVARREVVAARGWPPSPEWSREGVRLFTVPR